jgi:tetratricopeptide (TPR) repeat protein
MFRFKGTDLDPFEIGRQLNAHGLLIGRILQIDEELIIKLELINIHEGSQIWGEQYKRNAADIFEVQEEISQEVSGKLKLRLTREQKRQLTKRYTEDIEAYHLYLKGRYCWNKRTGEALKMAIEFFQEAIAKDPDYALAYTGLADSYAIIAFYSNMPPKPAFEEAKRATDKALEIDDSLAEAHASLAFVNEYYEWDWVGAGKEYKQAIELNPNYATVHQWYGMYFMKLGQFERARRELKRALRLDPRSLIINADLGLPFYFKRQYDEAIEQYRRVLEIDPDFIWARYFLGWAYERSGKFSEAVAEFEKAKLIDERPEVSAMIAHTYALSGKKSRAVSTLNNLLEQSKYNYISPYYIALIHAGLDDKEQAFAWLEKGYSDRNEWLVWLKIDPRFDCLWTDTRFPQLLSRIGFNKGESEGNALGEAAMSHSNRVGTDPDNFVARTINGVTLIESGRYDDAIAELKKARDLIDNAEAMAFLGYALAIAGRREDALALLKELHEAPIPSDIDPALMTVVYAGLEENDQAFEFLGKAYQSRSVWLTLISISPLFAKLRSDPRFTKLSYMFGKEHVAKSTLP